MIDLTPKQKSQCAIWALDRLHALGGHLVICKSAHWFIPHVMHFCRSEGLTHFVPFADLKAPWYSLFGFHGKVLVADNYDRQPLSKAGLFVGSSVLVVIVLVWVIHRQFVKFSENQPHNRTSTAQPDVETFESKKD